MSITFLQEPNAYKEIANVWWIGETITLDTTTKVYYFYFEAWWGLYRKDIYCEVYLTDENHHPVGDPIATASDHLNAWEKHQVRERGRFYFWGLIFEAGVEYFILIRDDEPTWHINSRIYIREGDSIYPGGMLYYSENSGETWTEFPNDDIVFALTGTPEVPPPPPPAPIKNFAILDIEQTATATGMKIVVTTNVPCHLYCYWTAHEPQKHLIPILTRGIELHTQLKMCFVDWTENEQEEPLDTLTHTFTKEPWAVCEMRWLTFRAKVMNEWVKSVGPIFKKHRVAPEVPAPSGECYQLENCVLYGVWSMGKELVWGMIPCSDFTTNHVRLWFSSTEYTDATPNLYFHIWESPDAGTEPTDLLTEGYWTGLLPRKPDYRQLDITFPLVTLLAGHFYHFGCLNQYQAPYCDIVRRHSGSKSLCWKGSYWNRNQNPDLTFGTWRYAYQVAQPCHQFWLDP